MEIQELLKTGNIAAIKTKLEYGRKNRKVTFQECIKQYDPHLHNVFDLTKRPKKVVKKPDPHSTEADPKVITSYEEVARIGFPYQELITKRAAGFMLANPIEFESNVDDKDQSQVKLLSMVKRILADNKTKYKDKEIARLWFSECEVAELWYLAEASIGFWNKFKANIKSLFGNHSAKYTYKLKILAQSKGDTLYPYFENDDLVAFGREYTVTNEKVYTYFECYTKDMIYKWITADGVTVPVEHYPMPNKAGKINIIYYFRESPIWHKSQPAIDRIETLVSNFADTNDYFGSPIMTVSKVKGFATKGESGKVFELEENGKMDILSWDSAPEAIKLEYNILHDNILSSTQTPDISFQQMKGIGNVSGIALKLMFLDAHLSAKNNEEVFGEMQQRRLNFLISAIGNFLDVSLNNASKQVEMVPEFTPYLPENIQEEAKTCEDAYASGAISLQRLVEIHPLVADPVQELERIKEENKNSISEPYV